MQHKRSCKFEVCVRLLVQGDSEKIILSIFTNNLLNLLQDIGEIDISQAEEALLSTELTFDILYTSNNFIEKIIIVA